MPLLYAVAILLLSAFSACQNQAPKEQAAAATTETTEPADPNQPKMSKNTQSIAVPTFDDLATRPSAVILDVRTPGEFDEGHIPNAINIDIKDPKFKAKAGELDKSQPVLVYCKSGRRSLAAAAILEQEGFQEIYNLKGGYDIWSKMHQ